MAVRILPALGAGLTLLALLSACSSVPARSKPDEVEKAAASAAHLAATFDRVPAGDDTWVQLWTPTQAGTQIAGCVRRGTEGLVEFQPKPLALNAGGLSYSVGFRAGATVSAADGGVGPPFFDDGTVKRIVDGCIADHPVDSRLFSVPAKDRRSLYAYDLTFLRRCLMSHGQRVQRMPTRERFEGLLRASAPWNAYELVVVKTRAAWYALADACPALPINIAGDVAAITTSASTP